MVFEGLPTNGLLMQGKKAKKLSNCPVDELAPRGDEQHQRPQ